MKANKINQLISWRKIKPPSLAYWCVCVCGGGGGALGALTPPPNKITPWLIFKSLQEIMI